MKKLITLFILAALLIPSAGLYAQDDGQRSVDDSTIEESLREEGLDQRPEVVEMSESEVTGEAPSSGFVDDDGNPISDEDYNKMREDDKSRAQRNRIILVVGLVVIAGAVGGAVVYKKKNK